MLDRLIGTLKFQPYASPFDAPSYNLSTNGVSFVLFFSRYDHRRRRRHLHRHCHRWFVLLEHVHN